MKKGINKKLIITVMLISTLCSSAYAADSKFSSEQSTYLKDHISDTWVDNYISKTPTKNGQVTVGGNVYYYKDGEDQSTLQNSIDMRMKSSNVKQSAVDSTGGVTINANTGAANQLLSGFVPIINILLGIIVVIITLGLAVYTAFDVCYIVFPVFRNKCEDARTNGNGALVKTTHNGDTKLRWVSDEAQFAVKSTVETGKSPLTLYLQKRVIAYIGVSVVLFILLTGNISIITDIALKVVSGIVDVLQGLT